MTSLFCAKLQIDWVAKNRAVYKRVFAIFHFNQLIMMHYSIEALG